jgi:hypothetical protein
VTQAEAAYHDLDEDVSGRGGKKESKQEEILKGFF